MLDNINDNARFFDSDTSSQYKNLEHALCLLYLEESFANILLKNDGKLYLYEAIERLGLDITDRDYEKGWVYDPDGDEQQVDFGITLLGNCYSDDRTILLNFNANDLID